MRRLSLVTLLVVLLAVTGQAQTFRGAINGTVTDPSGAVVAGAEVKATNNGTAVVLSTMTTSDGGFAFQDLPLGSYKITVNAGGFQQTTVDNVTVTAGQVYTLPVKLTMGQQTTTVEVSAAAVALDSTTATQTMTVPSVVVQDTPLSGRDFTQLISVQPGVGGYNIGGFGSLNGTRGNQMNWQIDGVDNNDFWHNIPAVNQGGVSGIAGVILPIDSIDEFSSQTQNGSEAGRNAGGTVNVVTKSGTNTLHGSVYYFNRNEFYAASSPFKPPTQKQPPLRNENYGFSLGGPIIRNKAFFFASYEKQQYVFGLSGLATEPSAPWVDKAAALLGNQGNAYGNYASIPVSQVSCNMLGPDLTSSLPASAPCTSVVLPTGGLWPTSGAGSITNLPATLKNFFSPVASTGYSYNGVGKIDYNFTENHHLSVRWFGGQGSQTAPLGGSPALGTASSNLKYYFEVGPIHVYNYSAILNSVFSPRLTNQVLVGVNYFNQTFSDFNHSFNTKQMGLFLSPDATNKGQYILGAPAVAISGFEQAGITPPEGRNDITGHLTDIISYTAGAHQLRFGGEFRQAHVNEFYHFRGTGAFNFKASKTDPWSAFCTANPATPGCDANTQALADFLRGEVQSSSIGVGNPERFVKVNGVSAFFQDAWQVSPKLNLNLGLRYEYFGPLYSTKKDLGVFVPGKGLLIQGNGIDSIFPSDKNNVAPRVGFAYRPRENGNLVVRGSVGVFYDQINMNPFLDFRPLITGADGLQDNPIGPSPVSSYGAPLCPTANGSYNWDAVQKPICPDGVTPNPLGSVFPGAVACANPRCTGNPGFNVFSVSQNFRTPYFYNYSFQVERSLGNSAVLQVGYVGSEGRKLNIMSNINQNGAFSNFGTVLQLNSVGTSNYNSLQSILRIRSWHGLTSQFAYTWGHAMDETSQYRSVVMDDAFNIKRDYGNSDFDTRHLFTVNFTYDVPGSSWGPKLLTHGWQVSSLMNFHTGQPYDEVLSRLNQVGNPFGGLTHSFSQANGGTLWVNPTAFCDPNAGDPGCTGSPYGNVGRNTYYAPGFGSVDLTVFKNIPITERFKLRVQASMFNMFNRINLVSGVGAISAGGVNGVNATNCVENFTTHRCAAFGSPTYSGFGLVSDTIGDFNGAPGIGPGEPFHVELAAKIIF